MNEFEKLEKAVKRNVEECPWAKDQTIEKHIKELRGEIDELEKAIQNRDEKNIREELADVFYDTLVLMKIAERDNKIVSSDAFKKSREKLVRRSPWVFGDVKVNSIEEAIRVRDEIKKKEKENM